MTDLCFAFFQNRISVDFFFRVVMSPTKEKREKIVLGFPPGKTPGLQASGLSCSGVKPLYVVPFFADIEWKLIYWEKLNGVVMKKPYRNELYEICQTVPGDKKTVPKSNCMVHEGRSVYFYFEKENQR